MIAAVRVLASACLAGALVCVAPAPARAQDPNPGALTFTGGVDFLNAYYFRGIPQDESGLIMWPYADLEFAVYSGDGGIRSLGVNVGTWNSLHTGDMGLDSAAEKLWYESDFYATLGLGFGGGTSLGITYTAYNSPNGMFATVRELAFKFAVDDSPYLGGAAVRPYVLLARELGDAQADGGLEAGTYLELGIAPGYSAARASFAVPVKVGLSLGDYYEIFDPQGDEAFGFFSIAGVVTVPFTSMPTSFGSWNVHGGVEYLRLGERNRALGANNVIASVGIGFTY